MTSATKSMPRKPRPRPADLCRLVAVIRGEQYRVRPNPNAPGLAWRLRKADGTSYDVTARDCTCGDFQYRHAGHEDDGCKHQRALRVLGLLPAADAVVEDDPTDPDNGDPATWPEWTDRQAYTFTRS